MVEAFLHAIWIDMSCPIDRAPIATEDKSMGEGTTDSDKGVQKLVAKVVGDQVSRVHAAPRWY
jgi:hypothetical protein